MQVIMMVESADGQRALLGRSRGHRPGMLTCLAGFVDQCESVGEDLLLITPRLGCVLSLLEKSAASRVAALKGWYKECLRV